MIHLRPVFLAMFASVVVATGACSAGDSGAVALVGDDYTASMSSICSTTQARLDALPDPPEAISPTDWADEVALAFAAEAESASALLVDRSIRSTHGDYVTTTTDLAAGYTRLASTLADDPAGIGDVNTEITELSLGRDDLAAELGLAACMRSAR